MFILGWNDKYLTGIELIDKQHKELFELLNVYAVKCDIKMNFDETFQLLNNLTDYTLRHFQAEEAFMHNSGYPDLTQHQAHHNNMKFDVLRYNTLFDAPGTDKVAIFKEISEFIAKWLTQHVDVEDGAFAAYYQQKNQPTS